MGGALLSGGLRSFGLLHVVGFVRVVIVGQEWLRQVQQSSRTRGTDSIGDAICLIFFLILLSRNRQIPGLATGAVGHSLFYSRR